LWNTQNMRLPFTQYIQSSSSSDLNIFLSALFWITLSLCSSINVPGQVSHPSRPLQHCIGYQNINFTSSSYVKYTQPSYYLHITTDQLFVTISTTIIIIICNCNYVHYLLFFALIPTPLQKPIKVQPPHIMDQFYTTTNEVCNIYKYFMHKYYCI
jgi:hypothetical protein